MAKKYHYKEAADAGQRFDELHREWDQQKYFTGNSDSVNSVDDVFAEMLANQPEHEFLADCE